MHMGNLTLPNGCVRTTLKQWGFQGMKNTQQRQRRKLFSDISQAPFTAVSRADRWDTLFTARQVLQCYSG